MVTNTSSILTFVAGRRYPDVSLLTKLNLNTPLPSARASSSITKYLDKSLTSSGSSMLAHKRVGWLLCCTGCVMLYAVQLYFMCFRLAKQKVETILFHFPLTFLRVNNVTFLTRTRVHLYICFVLLLGCYVNKKVMWACSCWCYQWNIFLE